MIASRCTGSRSRWPTLLFVVAMLAWPVTATSQAHAVRLQWDTSLVSNRLELGTPATYSLELALLIDAESLSDETGEAKLTMTAEGALTADSVGAGVFRVHKRKRVPVFLTMREGQPARLTAELVFADSTLPGPLVRSVLYFVSDASGVYLSDSDLTDAEYKRLRAAAASGRMTPEDFEAAMSKLLSEGFMPELRRQM